MSKKSDSSNRLLTIWLAMKPKKWKKLKRMNDHLSYDHPAGVDETNTGRLQPAKAGAMTHRILIADDLVCLAELMREWLVSKGFAVMVVHDGKAAADFLNQRQVALVILDVEMPGLDSLEVCAFIRRHTDLANLPVILSTGRDNSEDREHADRLEVHAFIPKPFSLQDLLLKVSSAKQTKPHSPIRNP